MRQSIVGGQGSSIETIDQSRPTAHLLFRDLQITIDRMFDGETAGEDASPT